MLLSFLAASATGLVLYFKVPFPEMNVFLNLVKARDLPTFCFLKYSYISFLFAIPFFAFSLTTSFLYLCSPHVGKGRSHPDCRLTRIPCGGRTSS